ncbi:hypothetical protein KPK_1848 [Klebsiella variicola]|uniref:Uncharacterized protein n=1 Tax=Klebsiella variicola (strain 342) TaxID=507522 RepID=B5XPU7_KLEV3|nr:hypothetical protein KPK_1848 [Klebsiella variicola]
MGRRINKALQRPLTGSISRRLTQKMGMKLLPAAQVGGIM